MSSAPKSTIFASLLKYAREEKESWSPVKLAPISPCPEDLIEEVLENLNLSAASALIDLGRCKLLTLGCGDGRWLCAGAAKYGCHCWGVDIEPNRIVLAHEKSIQLGVASLVHLIQADFRCLSLKHFSVVIVYLFPAALELLKGQFIKQCCDGTTVISIGFHIKGFPIAESFQSKTGLSAYKYTNFCSTRF